MRLRAFASVAVAALVALCATPVSAGYLTTNASFMAQDSGFTTNPGGNPPVIHIQSMGYGNGQLWTNQIGGAPFANGSTVRTVGAASVANFLNGSVNPVELPNGSPFHVVFAIEGTIIAPGVAQFTSGSLWYAASETGNPLGDFDPFIPESWNFENSFAKFDLAPPMSVFDGTSEGLDPSHSHNISAVAVNKSAVNLFGEIGDGVFVFQEDLSFVPLLPGGNPGLGTNVGSDWMFDAESAGGPLFEGLVAVTQQTVDNTPAVLTPGGLATLDAIALASLGGAFSEGGFTPTSEGAGSGDFSAFLTVHTDPIVAVPEPSSMAILGLLCGGAAIRFTKRRNQEA